MGDHLCVPVCFLKVQAVSQGKAINSVLHLVDLAGGFRA